jgi:hypothetical protein
VSDLYGPGGFIQPGPEQPVYTRPGCGIAGYCPTHDGRLIAKRGGKFVDVTEEAIAARLPDLDD